MLIDAQKLECPEAPIEGQPGRTVVIASPDPSIVPNKKPRRVMWIESQGVEIDVHFLADWQKNPPVPLPIRFEQAALVRRSVSNPTKVKDCWLRWTRREEHVEKSLSLKQVRCAGQFSPYLPFVLGKINATQPA
ncbi:hypothetical protein [Sinorhizobium meliloti]|uniref:hypothetical protein n=1 Tax=Rhizobium meliloti TaxID=382 RepID=UPI000FD87DCE|nr:hypothetical protein [Sinorhizobium meliloti]RVH97627.1 hypothetical protein CN199_07830 [Sinorhizobium meliloti]RVK82294.1 hypothetical protein CN153_26210 [Sinorhizobium meliloti]RVL18199.1 hypothetical protein CN143_19875 [Sinorhizobium meliloti]RVP39451.1 hypothetical protein CN081_08495 [Sinorhizobium meliloti]